MWIFSLHYQSQHFVHAEVKGKRGRKVPLLIPKQTELSISLIIKSKPLLGAQSSNPYVFATKNGGFLRGAEALM